MTVTPDPTPAAAPVRRRSGLAALAALAALLLAGVAAPRAAAHELSGHLYGEVTTTGGRTYTGVLRWADEEAFWDDLFNSSKVELPHLKTHGDRQRGNRTVDVFGRKIKLRWGDYDYGRQFATRFGEIRVIDVDGHDSAELTMSDGTKIRVEGTSNDVEADVVVLDPSLGRVEIPWKKIDRVVFEPTPADAQIEGYRLMGEVETTEGRFVGGIQWDKQECLSIDKLDGDEDGIDLSLEMGTIRSIERRGSSSSRVTLKDGRELVLDNSNDVDDDNRGILVWDDRFGKVEISWDAFRKATFRDRGDSGHGLDWYDGGGPLRGTVTDLDDNEATGRIVVDLDEAYTWEMLDGNLDEIAFAIPFGMVKSLSPRGGRSTRVELRSGEELELEGTQDVSGSNDGVLVFRGDDDGESEPVYIPWSEVRRIEFD